MKKILFALLVFMAATTGCNTAKDSGDPKIVVEKFVDAVSRKDMATVRSLSTADSKFMIDQMESSMNNNGGEIKNFQFDKSKVQLGDAVISGDNATVPVTELKSGESIDLPLKKENGEWKISFDMSSMMNMAMKKMQEKGINMDSLRGAIPELQKLNIDSLTREMNSKGISIDSIRNEMMRKGINLDSLKGTIKID